MNRYSLNEKGQITTPEGTVMTTSLILAHLNDPRRAKEPTNVVSKSNMTPLKYATHLLEGRNYHKIESRNPFDSVFQEPYSGKLIVLDTITEEDPVTLKDEEVVLTYKVMTVTQYINQEWGDDNYMKNLDEAIAAARGGLNE
jgi:hypothetical protein